MNNFTNLGERFSNYLKYKELGNNKTAEILGFSGSQVSNIVNGKVFGTDKIFKILNVFQDIDANWLFRNEGEMLKPNVKETSHFENVKKSVKKSVKNQLYKNIHTLQDTDISLALQAKDETIAQLKERVAGLEQDKKDLKEQRDKWEHLYKLASKEIEELKNMQDTGHSQTLVG